VKTLFSRLFRAHTQSRRSSIRTIRRQPALGVEALDQRLLPSVTATLSNGLLDVRGDAGNDSVKVSHDPAGIVVYLQADFQDGTSMKTFFSSDVQKVRFVGGGGMDYFKNYTNLPVEADGRGSMATLIGGSGDDTFWIDGNDTVDPGAGNNVTYGLAFGRLTPAELEATGQLAASLNGSTLTLSGPGGAGFQIVGNWVRTGAANVSSFTASGHLTLKSALGDIPFVAAPAAPLTIQFAADGLFSSEGVVTGIKLSGIPDLSVNGTGPLATLSNELGLNVSLPSVSWGLKLGSDLDSLDLPVDAGVPYLYATVNTGFTATFGSARVSTSGDKLSFAFDPADPSVAARVGEFAVGGSIKGYIPFTPVAQPSGASDPIFGNLYGAGAIQLGELPVSLKGSVVIDLDANDDGKILGMSGNTFSKVLQGQQSLASLATNALNDLKVGINGTVSLGYDLNGFDITLLMANASVMYSPGSFAFCGEQVNLFAGTPVDKLVPKALQDAITPPSYSVDDSITWGSDGVQNWHLTAAADNVTLGGSFKATHTQFTIDNTGITADAQISGLEGWGQVEVRGAVDYKGNFTLTTQATASFDAGPCSLGAEFDFTFSNKSGSVKLSANMTASFEFGVGSSDAPLADVSASITAGLTFSVNSTGVHISGYGTAQGSMDVLGIGSSVDVNFSFNDNGFTLDLPNPLPNLSVNW
jgi:hypothetical protein